jgi:hypothetical protein
MERLIELYEMVSLNETALRGNERIFLQKARLALRLFEREMHGLAERLSPSSVEQDSFAASTTITQVMSAAAAQTSFPLPR